MIRASQDVWARIGFAGIALLVLAGGAMGMGGRLDAAGYFEAGQALGAYWFGGADYNPALLFRPPLYPLMLYVVGLIFGSHWLYGAVLLNAACLVAAYVLLTRLARILLTAAAQWVLLALLLLNLPLLREVMAVRETALYLLILACFLHLLVSVADQRRVALLGGALVGVAMLVRPSGVLLLPVLLLVLLYRAPAGRRISIGTLNAGFALVLAALVAVPWIAFASAKTGHVLPTGTCTSGVNLFKGNHPMMPGPVSVIDVDKAQPQINLVFGYEKGMDVCEFDALLQREAASAIRKKPAVFVKAAALKAALLLSPIPPYWGDAELAPDTEGHLMVQNFEPLVSSRLIVAFYAMFLLPFALIGLWRELRDGDAPRRTVALLIGLIVGGHVLLHALTFPEHRFRLPLEPLAAVLAAGALARAIRPESSKETA